MISVNVLNSLIQSFLNLDLLIILISTSVFIYFIGIFGIITNKDNFLITILSAEIIYLSIIVLFSVIGSFLQTEFEHICALILIVLAAAESAVGLGLLVVIFRFIQSIKFYKYQELRG